MTARAVLGAAAVLLGACAPDPAASSRVLSPPPISFAPPGAAAAGTAALGPGRVEDRAFRSGVLARDMALTVYLPPGYDGDASTRFPTLYMLHGGSGLRSEWIDYGLLAAADRLMRERAIARFLIVLPQGDQEYWVDHVVDASVGANGERWGTYTAREVVPVVDAHYRTIARAEARAIGGLSMGAHGAMQLALNFPGVWGVIGAHSPALRPYGDAPTYLGRDAEFAARDPLQLVRAKPEVARSHTWWIDAGDVDPWRDPARAISEELTVRGIANEWRQFPGDHSLAYWTAHVEEYLRYYSSSLCERSRPCAR